MPDLITAYLRNAVLFVPAIGFMLVMRALPGDGDAHWRLAALAGALLALPHTAWLLRRRPLHGTALGLNAYLIVSAALPFVSADANRAWGETLGSAAMLVCVLATHAIGLAVAPEAFSGAADPALAQALCKKMVAYGGVALAVAFPHRHDPLFGGVLPVVALILLHKRLRRGALAPIA